MARKSKPTEYIRGTVTIERDGQAYEGSYRYANKWVTVTYDGCSKEAAVHEAPPGNYEFEFVARMLLSELVPVAKAIGP